MDDSAFAEPSDGEGQSERIFSNKRAAIDEAGEGRSSKKRTVASQKPATELVDSSDGENSALLSGISLMKLKRLDIGLELLKLPRFGAKLNAAPGDLENLSRRLKKIYDCKLGAFKWPRYREIVLSGGTEGTAKKNSDGLVGRLNLKDYTVEVTRFRGSFSSYFGKFCMIRDGIQVTTLTPFETYFLMDSGTLEVTLSDSCVLAVEDVRALMEAGVPNFSRRYAVFSELHRATQLYAKKYGNVRKAKSDTKTSTHILMETSDDFEKYLPSTSTSGALDNLTMNCIPQWIRVFNFPNLQTIDRPWRSVETARKMLDLPETTESEPAVLVAPDRVDYLFEIPPFTLAKIDHPLPLRDICSAEKLSDSIDVAFTCYSRISAVGVTTSQFDVAVTDFRQRDILLADLFSTLTNRIDPALPMYVAKEDMGQMSGFAAVLADVPVVCYQGQGSTDV